MDIGSVLAALALLAVVAAYLVRPLLERRGQGVSDEDHELSVLLAERDRVLSSLQDLDMDYSMDKILQEDYTRQRQELVKEGARILRRLDELESQDGLSGEAAEVRSLEAEIEAEVAALRQSGDGQQQLHFCPSCGRQVEPEDRFCTHCGEPLTEEVRS